MTSIGTTDLSQYHTPITDLFPSTLTKEDENEMGLSDDEINHFLEFGYLSNVRILTEDQCDVLLNQLETTLDVANPRHKYFYEFNLNESADVTKVLFHALGAWRVNPYFHDLLWAPRLRVVLSQILNASFSTNEKKSVRLFHDQLFCKPSHHGAIVGWHQDYAYWKWTKPIQHITCWLPLDDSTEDNGCLRYVPNSHNWGLIEDQSLGLTQKTKTIQIDGKVVNLDEVSVPQVMKRGCASFHHPLLIHGSLENRSDNPRRACALNFFLDGTQSNWYEELSKKTADEVLKTSHWGGEGFVPAKQDQPWEGSLFPIISN